MTVRPSPPAWAVRTKADELAMTEGAWWDQSKADAVIRFSETLFQPQYISGAFRLLPWQRRFLSSLYAWRWPDGRRRFRTASLHVPKKNGKTLITALVCAYELIAAGEPSPYVASAAASRENASQIFDELRHSIERSPFAEFAKVRRTQKRIEFPDLNATFVSLAYTPDKLHGWNLSTVVLDEVHSHLNSKLYDALKYATASRPNGLCVLISTCGNDSSHFYHGIYSKSKRILSGEDLDTIWYAEVYESDLDADPASEDQIAKANPSLGVSFDLRTFRSELASAKSNYGDWLNFQRLRLNRWVRADELAYFDLGKSDNVRTYTDAELKQFPCWLGLDGSATTDPTSLTAVWRVADRQYHARSWAWVCQEGVELREKSNLPVYRQFPELTILPGNMIDDRVVSAQMLDVCKTFQVQQINFDPATAYRLMSEFQAEGYSCGRFPQSHRYFNGPMQFTKAALEEGRITHEGSSWLRYCLSNVRADLNRYGEVRPCRKRSVDKIDGAVSLLLALVSAFDSDQQVSPPVWV